MMKILVFTEGTILKPKFAEGLGREEIVEKSRKEEIQREEVALQYKSKDEVPVEPNSVHDFANYIPTGNAVEKLTKWKEQGAEIYYLSSRRIKPEVEAIRAILQRYNFPEANNLLFRKEGEEYKDAAQQLIPDILIEDDCESIGGEADMTYPHINPELKERILSVIVKEFAGIDQLPDSVSEL